MQETNTGGTVPVAPVLVDWIVVESDREPEDRIAQQLQLDLPAALRAAGQSGGPFFGGSLKILVGLLHCESGLKHCGFLF